MSCSLGRPIQRGQPAGQPAGQAGQAVGGLRVVDPASHVHEPEIVVDANQLQSTLTNVANDLLLQPATSPEEQAFARAQINSNLFLNDVPVTYNTSTSASFMVKARL